MKRRGFLAGLTAALTAAWEWPAKAGFGIFQVNGPGGGGGGGVTFQAPDGGASYYTANSFSYATASHTFNGITYATGWDSPNFFPIGMWLDNIPDQATANIYLDVGVNTMVGFFSNQSLPILRTNGIYALTNSFELFSTFTSGTSGGILNQAVNAGVLGSETVGLVTFDEPVTYFRAVAGPLDSPPGASFTGTIMGNGGSLNPLGANPFATTNTSNQVVVTDSIAPQLSVGSHVQFTGATTFNNVNMNTKMVIASIAGGTYTVTAPTNANATGSGGGSSVQAAYDGGYLTVTAISSGVIYGEDSTQSISSANTVANTVVGQYGTGTGGLGTYTLGIIGGSGPGQIVFPAEAMTIAAATPVNNTLQDGRFWYCDFSYIPLAAGTGNIGAPGGLFANELNALINTPSGTGIWAQRHIDMTSFDFYWYAASKGTPADVQLSMSGLYNITTPLSLDWSLRGSHYGDSVDMVRIYQNPASVGGAGWITVPNPQPNPIMTSTPYPAPILQFIDPGGAFNENLTQTSYTSPPEIPWAGWASIIHGCRFICYFGYSFFPSPAPTSNVFRTAFYGPTNIPSTTFTASITGTTLTVAGSVAPGTIQVPSILTGTGVSTSPQQWILQQLGSANDASFTGQVTLVGVSPSGSSTVNVSGITGTITVPCLMVGAGISDPVWIASQASGTTGGNGVYNLRVPIPSTSSGAMSTYRPGGDGNYLLSVSNTLASRSMTSTQTISIYNQGKAFNAFVQALAPVINAQFALGYVVSVSPQGYKFPTMNLSIAPGIDTMVKNYTGATFNTNRYTGYLVVGDSITAGYYIFACTRNSETNTNISATFTINDPLALSITVINESRTISFTSGLGTTAAIFSDTFAYAWTVHIYQVNH